MTTHELARMLLSMPDAPAHTRNQTYDETTYPQVDMVEGTELVDTGCGDIYGGDHFRPRLDIGVRYFKGMVIL